MLLSVFHAAALPAREEAAKGSDAEGRAFGELNYLKPAQEQASFMSGPRTMPALCGALPPLRGYTCCVCARASVHVRVAVRPGMNVLIMKVNLFRGVIN